MKMDVQYIEKLIADNNYKLLGQIEVSDADYKQLIDYISFKVENLYMPTIPNPDLVLSLALVQVAIRCYKDGRFWPCFEEEIGYKVPSTRLNYIGKIFFKTIKSYNRFF